MQPLIFLDLETTGLSYVPPHECAPLSIAAFVLAGPNHGKEFHHLMRPFPNARVFDIALSVNGFKASEIDSFPHPMEAFVAFRDWITELDDAYNEMEAKPQHKLAGWNIKFDDGFLRAWIARCYDPSYYGNVFHPVKYEVMDDLKICYPDHKIRFADSEGKGGGKLTQVYKGLFGKDFAKAHTAAGDVTATRDCFLHFDQRKTEPLYSEYHHYIDYDNQHKLSSFGE